MRRALGALAAIGIGAIALVAWAGPGDLDTSFGADGIVVNDLSADEDVGRDLTIDDSGRIVVVGNSVVVGSPDDAKVLRYLPDGSLDPDFATGGIATHTGPETDWMNSVAIGPAGNIVVGGHSTDSFSLLRLKPDGTVDTDFGTDGVVATDIDDLDFAEAMSVNADGDIVLVGHTNSLPGTPDIVVLRYNSNGTLDPSFGTAGAVVTDFGGNEQARDVVWDGTGILVAAKVDGTDDSDLGVVRYHADGSLDTNFGDSGLVRIDAGDHDSASSLTSDGDGNIIALGSTPTSSSRTDLVLARLSPDGSLDASFGTDGLVVTRHGSDSISTDSVAVDSQGRIVVSGHLVVSGGNDLAVARYLPGGTLDPDFGTNGFATARVAAGQNLANGVALDDSDRILLTGTYRTAVGVADLIVARFEGAPPPSTTSTTTTTTVVEDAFGDDDGSVFEGDIDAVAAAGITRGCNPPDNDRFCPGDYVTRGQMAAFLNRALGLPEADRDAFGDDDGSVFEGDIDAVAAAGITRGCNPPDNDRYCPGDNVTRGQMAAFLNRAFLD